MNLLKMLKSANENDIIKAISENIEINEEDNDKRTPLMLAIIYKYNRVINILLDKNVDCNCEDIFGCNALYYACLYNNEKITDISVSCNQEIKNKALYLLCDSQLSENDDKLRILKILIKNGSDINYMKEHRYQNITNYGESILSLSIINNNLDITKYLILVGANINLSDSYGTTPLMIACEKNKIHCVNLLLENNVELEKSDIWERTALTIAVIKGHIEIVLLLLKAGSNVNKVDTYGMSILSKFKNDIFAQSVLDERNKEILQKILIDHGAE